MKKTILPVALVLLALSALADDAALLRAWIATQPLPHRTAALVNDLAAPVASETNTVQLVMTNDVDAVALRAYLKANKPLAVTRASTFAQIRAAWSNDVASASSANKPSELSEQAVWMAVWFAQRTVDDLPSTVTNAVQQINVLQRRWEALGLSRQPNGNDVEAAQR